MASENEADQTGHAAEMTPKDTLIKFCLDNDVQKGVINELLEKGFDSINTFKLVESEDIRSQKIPIGQLKLLLYLAKSLTDTQSQTASTAGSAQSVQETASVSQQPEIPNANTTQVNLQATPVAHATPVAMVSNPQNNVDTYQTLIDTLLRPWKGI